MRPRVLLAALAPLLVATLALALREVSRPVAGVAPLPGTGEPLPGPPALLLALPISGRWEVVGVESRLLLIQRDAEGGDPVGAVELRGEVVLEPDGRLADLDIDALLAPAGARALLGPLGEGQLALRAVAARSVPGAVPGSRCARPEAWLSLDGTRRPLPLRAAWMPIGPGRVRMQLEAGWDGSARGDDDALGRLLRGSRSSTLALDLVLARS